MCKSDNNMDIFTSIVRVKGNKNYKVIPVKSTSEVDKSLWIEFSKVISRLYVNVPIMIGDIICKNVLNTGIDIICTRDVADV
jgi:CxxC motif-containing protein